MDDEGIRAIQLETAQIDYEAARTRLRAAEIDERAAYERLKAAASLPVHGGTAASTFLNQHAGSRGFRQNLASVDTVEGYRADSYDADCVPIDIKGR